MGQGIASLAHIDGSKGERTWALGVRHYIERVVGGLQKCVFFSGRGTGIELAGKEGGHREDGRSYVNGKVDWGRDRGSSPAAVSQEEGAGQRK